MPIKNRNDRHPLGPEGLRRHEHGISPVGGVGGVGDGGTARDHGPSRPSNWRKHPRRSSSSIGSRSRRIVISPSPSSRYLMRAVSGLGMEDPVFASTTRGDFARVPLHSSQNFDDMSFADIPCDMQDLVTVASDPTADLHTTGIDAKVLRSCLGDLVHGISKYSRMELRLSQLSISVAETENAHENTGGTNSSNKRNSNKKSLYHDNNTTESSSPCRRGKLTLDDVLRGNCTVGKGNGTNHNSRREGPPKRAERKSSFVAKRDRAPGIAKRQESIKTNDPLVTAAATNANTSTTGEMVDDCVGVRPESVHGSHPQQGEFTTANTSPPKPSSYSSKDWSARFRHLEMARQPDSSQRMRAQAAPHCHQPEHQQPRAGINNACDRADLPPKMAQRMESWGTHVIMLTETNEEEDTKNSNGSGSQAQATSSSSSSSSLTTTTTRNTTTLSMPKQQQFGSASAVEASVTMKGCDLLSMNQDDWGKPTVLDSAVLVGECGPTSHPRTFRETHDTDSAALELGVRCSSSSGGGGGGGKEEEAKTKKEDAAAVSNCGDKAEKELTEFIDRVGIYNPNALYDKDEKDDDDDVSESGSILDLPDCRHQTAKDYNRNGGQNAIEQGFTESMPDIHVESPTTATPWQSQARSSGLLDQPLSPREASLTRLCISALCRENPRKAPALFSLTCGVGGSRKDSRMSLQVSAKAASDVLHGLEDRGAAHGGNVRRYATCTTRTNTDRDESLGGTVSRIEEENASVIRHVRKDLPSSHVVASSLSSSSIVKPHQGRSFQDAMAFAFDLPPSGDCAMDIPQRVESGDGMANRTFPPVPSPAGTTDEAESTVVINDTDMTLSCPTDEEMSIPTNASHLSVESSSCPPQSMAGAIRQEVLRDN